MDENKELTVKAFAKLLGVSDNAVHKAIRAGKIQNGYLKSKKKIIYSVALDEWKKNYVPEKIQNNKLHDKLTEGVTDVEENSDDVKVDEKEIKLSNKANYNEAKRVEAIVKARTAQLEYEKMKGDLVSKKEVYKELFAVGQIVRTALQGIPDKYIDNILACDTRNEAHELLTKAIIQSLEELSNATKEIEL